MVIIPRLYYHYELWEEHHNHMWIPLAGDLKNIMLEKAIKFTGNHKLYGKYMRIITKQWIYSCAHNLSNMGINRQAWIGQAACCLAIKCPESITRLAWHYLSTKQQNKANNEADTAITLWENQFNKGYQICQNLV